MVGERSNHLCLAGVTEVNGRTVICRMAGILVHFLSPAFVLSQHLSLGAVSLLKFLSTECWILPFTIRFKSCPLNFSL